jgi:hypothetical protein
MPYCGGDSRHSELQLTPGRLLLAAHTVPARVITRTWPEIQTFRDGLCRRRRVSCFGANSGANSIRPAVGHRLVTAINGHRCTPGDITLMPVRGGFLIGRVLPEKGPGPWWEFIKMVPDRADAIEQAGRLLSPGGRLWFHERGDLLRAVAIQCNDAAD